MSYYVKLGDENLDLDAVTRWCCSSNEILLNGNNINCTARFDSIEEANNGLELINNYKNNHKQKGEKAMESFKNYIEKHRDIFFTIAIVMILDHFIFGGAFKEKLTQMINSFLDKKALDGTK